MARGDLKQGFFQPKNPQKYIGNLKNIVFRSSWELRLMRWCDASPQVVKWNSEDIVIPYLSPIDQSMHRYFVDFIVQIQKDGVLKNYLIEIKPHEQTMPPKKSRSKYYQKNVETWLINQAKWAAAKKWAEANGCEFVIMDEYSLGLAKRR